MQEIKGYEGLYSIDKEGNVFSHRSKKILSTFYSESAKGEKKYLRVSLSKEGKKSKFFIHRLIAFAYIPRESGRDFVNHKNGIKDDNRIKNLEWCTLSENNIHAVSIGLAKGYNGTMQKRNTSGYVGVTKSGKKWKAQIRIKNKLIYLGLHNTKEEASLAYWKYWNSLDNKKDK